MNDSDITHVSLHSIRRARRPHSTIAEGIRLGLIIGAATWLWVAGFDFAEGEPLMTFRFLGGPVGSTLVHFALCVAYGMAVISAVHGSMKEPSLILALIFCAILFQMGFVVLTAVLANVGLGQLAWGRFLGGNVMAAGLTYLLIARDHPMRDLYHAAEARQQD